MMKIVFTGAPGTGKSTLINTLLAEQFSCMPEISRAITAEAQKKGIDKIFLKEPLAFSQLLLDARKKQFAESNQIENPKNDFVFFDRGLPDITAYLDYVKTPYPESFSNPCQQLQYDIVFNLPPWEAIYVNDNERYETFEEAVIIDTFIVKAYESYGYKVINIPFDTPENRLKFVLSHINSN